MSNFHLSALFVSVSLLASCGNSENKSGQNCTPPNATQLKGIRAPVASPSTPTTPAQPTSGQAPQTNAANECTTSPAGNLASPTLPSAPQLPSLNGSQTDGQWTLVSEMCENGVLSERMKSTAEMLRSGQFSYQLNINNSTIGEIVNVSFTIENAGTMMCSMRRTSTLEKAGNQLQIKSPASSFADAGGDIPCNLGAVTSETIAVRQMQVQGTSLVIELPNAAECEGQSKVQVYTGRSR